MATASVVHSLGDAITSHVWSPDRTRVAVCLDSPDVVIFENVGDADTSKWTQAHVLKGHDLVVTSMDWCKTSGRLVTCSQDRNAFVWTFNDESREWDKKMVVLRFNRAATCCAWSPDGSKFAVASGAKLVAVCAFDEGNDWWYATHIPRFKSTVTTLAWHPNSVLLAAGGCDYHCRVAAAWIEEIGDTPDIGPFGSADGFSFGDFVVDVTPTEGTASTWINAVAWSPSGATLAFATQASYLYMVTAGPAVQAVRHKDLPFLSLAFTDEATLVAAGYDMTPTLFGRGWTGGWAFTKVADAEDKPEAAAASSSAFSSARAMFASKVAKAGGGSAGRAMSTKHEAAIVGVQSMTPAATAVAGAGAAAASGAAASGTFSTVGSDGRLVVWTM